MLSKNELKYIQSLCHKKQRSLEGLFIAEGTKLVNELLRSHYKVKKLYAVDEWTEDAAAGKTDVQRVSHDELQRISQLQTPNQVFAIVEQPDSIPPVPPSNGFVLITDGIQDPGNFGTIIRIADWFGIKELVASEDTVELYNPKVVQSTMGSFIRVNVSYTSIPAYLEQTTLPVFGALLAGKDMYQQQAVKDGVLVIGNEGNGIRPDVMPFIKYPVTIPRIGGAESLNAAVATGVLVSHLKKDDGR